MSCETKPVLSSFALIAAVNLIEIQRILAANHKIQDKTGGNM